MKRIAANLLLLCAFAGNTFAANDAITAPVAQEWQSYIEPLLPVGERIGALMTDPQDPQLRQELYRYLYAQISAGYIGRLYADKDYPDFWPFINQAYNTFAPNPDNSYYMTPIDGDGVYRISGFRGTVRMVDFQISGGTLYPQGVGAPGLTYANYDLDRLPQKNKDGSFEVILSRERPAGYVGNWWQLDPNATNIIVRQVAYDWLLEEDGRFAIDRLDRPAIKPRPTAQEIEANLKQIPVWVESWTQASLGWLAKLRAKGMVNKVEVHDLVHSGGVVTQLYIEGLYELGPEEALIYETEVPKKCRYWNLQITDALWSSIDWTNRQTSLNGYTARLDKDGKFRAVLAATDPGVPNWLDTAGYRTGAILGRWTECSSAPIPTITRVKLAELQTHLPADTPIVSAEARDATIRSRRKGVQLRRRW